MASNTTMAVDLPLLCTLMFRQDARVSFKVSNGIPEGARCVGAGVGKDGRLYLDFDQEVPPTVELELGGSPPGISRARLN